MVRSVVAGGGGFAHFTRVAFILSLIWIAYFFISGLYRDWYLQSRAVQLLVVSMGRVTRLGRFLRRSRASTSCRGSGAS